MKVIERDVTKQSKVVYWICECECGEIRSVASRELRDGNTKSCGCLNRELSRQRIKSQATTHGLSKTREHTIWSGIRARCFYEKYPSFHNWGGRGITMCHEWRYDAKSFIDYIKSLKDYGTPGFTLDRIDNNGNYEPGNLRWASHETQLRNTRKTKLNIEQVRQIRKLNGTMKRQDIGDMFNITASTVNEIVNNQIWRDSMKFDTLYSKDSTDNIRIWWMEIEGDRYRTHSGLINGTIITTEWTQAKAKNIGKKNELKPEEQAIAEVEAKYKKQLKTGYHLKIADINNTNYVEPMLAKKYVDYRHLIDFSTGLYCVELKYNGTRAIATKNGIFTRKGEKYLSIVHIEESLKPFFHKYPNAVLDGELFNFELRQKLNELNSLVRKTKNISQDDLDLSKTTVQYHIYDGYGFEDFDESKPYIDRIDWLNGNLSGSYLYLVDTYFPNSQEEFESLYNGFVEQGHEGAMVRFNSSPYEHKRSKFLLKVKPEDDSEAVIEKCHYGTGNWSSVFKTFTLNWNGKVFDATLKCSMEEAEVVTNNPEKWIGKRVTFLYNGLTGKGEGTPNFARVDVLNCEPST